MCTKSERSLRMLIFESYSPNRIVDYVPVINEVDFEVKGYEVDSQTYRGISASLEKMKAAVS